MPTAPSLHEVQQSFLMALHDLAAPGPVGAIAGNGLTPESRLRIYRHSCNEIQTAALRTSYPALLALGGMDWFNQTARGYRSVYHSTSGSLQAFGAHLGDYIETLPESQLYPYFADVARLEWLRQETMLAPRAQTLTTDLVMRALQTRGAAMQVTLHPSVHVLTSDYSVLSIWHFAQEPTPEGFDLDGAGEAVMLWRDDGEVISALLEPATFACVCALHDGDTLETAQASAMVIDPDFDMANCFESLTRQGLIVGIVSFPIAVTKAPACP